MYLYPLFDIESNKQHTKKRNFSYDKTHHIFSSCFINYYRM